MLSKNPYSKSLDFLCLISLICVIVSVNGLPIPMFGYIAPLFNFGQCVIFAVAGYVLLDDNQDLKAEIIRWAKFFGIVLAAYSVLAGGYLWLLYGSPFLYCTKRGIFNFVVLNYWGPSLGAYIWMIQSVLYCLIICYCTQKLKKLDWLFCILTFLIGIAVGEGSGILRFNILGYTTFPGNFLTKTMPYMLLGRILRSRKEYFRLVNRLEYIGIFAAGILVCVIELLGLSYFGKLAYYGHLVGFIPMVYASIALTVAYPILKKDTLEFLRIDVVFVLAFLIFNPFSEILKIVLLMLRYGSRQAFEIATASVGLITILCSIAAAYIVILIQIAIDRKRHPEKYEKEPKEEYDYEE